MKRLHNNCCFRVIFFHFCLFLVAWLALTGCEEREFPVTPQPEKFAQVPPSDVSLLKASGEDQAVAISWSSPPEDNIVKIHIKNVNDGTETVLDGKAVNTVFTNLTNLVTYTFVVKTENDKGLVSYGVNVSAIPFKPDHINPSTVTDLLGFVINDGAALATWQNPADPDLSHIVVYLGNDSVSVSSKNNYAIIRGDIKEGLIVKAVDLSGNYSDPLATSVDKKMISISGSDDGDNETIFLRMDPAVVIIDQYQISWGADKKEVISATSASYEIPLSDLVWLDPVKVGLMSNEALVTEYQYDHHNTLPGTIRAAYFDSAVGTIATESDMRNIGSIDDNESCSYNIKVNDTGSYSLTAYESRPDGTARYEVYIDGVLTGNGTVGGTGAWDQFQPFDGPVMGLTEGQHVMTIKFLNGGANYQKFLFKKL